MKKPRTILSRIYALNAKGKDAKQIAKAIDRPPNYVRTALWRMRNPERVKAYYKDADGKRYRSESYNKRASERARERYQNDSKYREQRKAHSNHYNRTKRMEARA